MFFLVSLYVLVVFVVKFFLVLFVVMVVFFYLVFVVDVFAVCLDCVFVLLLLAVVFVGV